MTEFYLSSTSTPIMMNEKLQNIFKKSNYNKSRVIDFFRDIIIPCAKIRRFNFMTPTAYRTCTFSVLEHSVVGARYINSKLIWADEKTRLVTAFLFLVHDLHEAVSGDIIRPIKRKYRDLEMGFLPLSDAFARIISDVTNKMSDKERNAIFTTVKSVDTTLNRWECVTFFPHWKTDNIVEADFSPFSTFDPLDNSIPEFKDLFLQLTSGLGIDANYLFK